LRHDAENGDALFGTIDTWLIYNLTAGKVHVTDVSNASRTLLMDINTCQWNLKLLEEFEIPVQMLPRIVPSAGSVGEIAENMHISGGARFGLSGFKGVSIAGILGDQQAALFGQTCTNFHDIKVTYGTGAFLLMNTGNDIVHSKHGLITTVAYQLAADAKPVYALEGSVAYAGATMQWCRDKGQFIKDTAVDVEACARNTSNISIDNYTLLETEITPAEAEAEEDVYFVPAFSGLFAPYWRSDARGLIVGLTAYHTRDHIVRAALESTAFNVLDVIHAMVEDVKLAFTGRSGYTLPSKTVVKVDGGMTDNSYLMQFQSNLLNLPLDIPKNQSYMTAMGALFAAGIGCGIYPAPTAGTRSTISNVWKLSKEYHPHLSATRREFKVSFEYNCFPPQQFLCS
jgi:glycerol kinase